MSSMLTTLRGRRSSERSSSRTRFFVTWNSHVVKRERSEKPRQPLVDAEEDLLRQILGQRPVADEAENVVVDRPLVGPNDDGERPLVAALGFPEDPEIRLFERQCAASVQPISGSTNY